MVAMSTVIRRLSPQSLRRYFADRDIVLPDVEWDSKKPPPSDAIVAAICRLDADRRWRIEDEIERIGELSDEPGHAAIRSVIDDTSTIDELANDHERSLWVFMNRSETFKRAEEVRYTDENRGKKRMWTGFVVEPGLDVGHDEETLAAFGAAIKQGFGSGNVHVEIFERLRTASDGSERRIVQAVVYSEGRPRDVLEFEKGQLQTRNRRPVIEASLTYDPEDGIIEVVARSKEEREGYARLFAAGPLSSDLEDGELLQARRFDLSCLAKVHTFPTDIEDGIENVRVTSMRLMPIDSTRERVALEVVGREAPSIWEIAANRFGTHNPLGDEWMVTQAKLVIHFRPEPGGGRGKTLPVTITMPLGCDLKERTDRERLVGEKYLRRWHLLEET